MLVKVGYDVFDFEPFTIYIKRAVENHVDQGRTTDVLKKKYLSALVEVEYDRTWEEAWADDADMQGQSAYLLRERCTHNLDP